MSWHFIFKAFDEKYILSIFFKVIFVILPVLFFDSARGDRPRKKIAATTKEICNMGSGHQSKLKDGFWLSTLQRSRIKKWYLSEMGFLLAFKTLMYYHRPHNMHEKYTSDLSCISKFVRWGCWMFIKLKNKNSRIITTKTFRVGNPSHLCKS